MPVYVGVVRLCRAPHPSDAGLPAGGKRDSNKAKEHKKKPPSGDEGGLRAGGLGQLADLIAIIPGGANMLRGEFLHTGDAE